MEMNQDRVSICQAVKIPIKISAPNVEPPYNLHNFESPNHIHERAIVSDMKCAVKETSVSQKHEALQAMLV